MEDKFMQKKIAVINDLSGYGRCSLTVAIPVLSAMGHQCCPIPTAILSNHTEFPVYFFDDYTEKMTTYTDKWKELGLSFDAIATGFLGSEAQIGIVMEIVQKLKAEKTFVVVDPVMGDGGEIYATYTPELCEAMGTLVDGADVLMPNLTEASMLTGRTYPGQNIDNAEVNGIIDALLALGAKNVVLKGVDRQDGIIRNYVASATSGASGKQEIAHDKLPFMTHGTGDAFASALCGAVMAGRPLAESAHIAGEFVRHAMESTQFQPNHTERGVSFELNLDELTRLVRR